MTPVTDDRPPETKNVPTLRERKKLATRLAIRQAALKLAVFHGVEHVTVDQISETAEVSPRTFFNYFACKEDALIGEDEEVFSELHEIIVNHDDGASPLQALRAAFAQSELLHLARSRKDDLLARQRLVKENPSLLPRQLAKYLAIEKALTAALVERLGVDADDPRPRTAAAIGTTVLRVAMSRWTSQGYGEPDELIDDTFDLLEHAL